MTFWPFHHPPSVYSFLCHCSRPLPALLLLISLAVSTYLAGVEVVVIDCILSLLLGVAGTKTEKVVIGTSLGKQQDITWSSSLRSYTTNHSTPPTIMSSWPWQDTDVDGFMDRLFHTKHQQQGGGMSPPPLVAPAEPKETAGASEVAIGSVYIQSSVFCPYLIIASSFLVCRL